MLCVQLDGALWETIRNISVDTQGEHMYSLRPRINNIQHRIVFDVKLVNNLKIVTIRSAMTIENNTLLPIDVGILDPRGQHFEDNIVKIGKRLLIAVESMDANLLIKSTWWKLCTAYWKSIPQSILCQAWW